MRRKTLNKFWIFAILFISSLRLNAGSFPEEQDKGRIQEEVTVTRKLIQVYVTDKKGNPVTDLEKEDFELKDNGEIVTITEFEKHTLFPPSTTREIRKASTDPSPSNIMPRKFFLFFDFAFNDLGGIHMAKQAALHFIDNQVHPSDELGVLAYSTHKGLVLHEYLTTDHGKIRELVQDIGVKEILGRAGRLLDEQQMQLMRGGEWSLPDNRMMEKIERENRDMREGMMRIGGQMEYRHQALHFTSAIKDMANALCYIPGHKHIILFSTGIPNWLMYRTAVESTPQLDKVNIAGSDAADLRRRYEDMSRQLAVANAPVYAVNVEGMYADFMDKDGRSDFTRWELDRQQPSSGIEARNWRGVTSLSNLASETGGKYFDNTNSAEKIAEEIQTMTGFYYVLGYPIDEKWDGKYHRINIKVKHKGYNVLAQRGYYNPKPFKDYSDLEKKIHLMDLALSAKPHFGNPVVFPMSVLSYETGSRSVAALFFSTADEGLRGVIGEKTEIVFLVFDEKQNIVGFRNVQIEDPGIFSSNLIPYAFLPLYPGSFDCRIVVRNLDTGKGAVASSWLMIPKSKDSGLRLYPPLLLTAGTKTKYLNAGRTEMREDDEEFTDLIEVYPFDVSRHSPLFGNAEEDISNLTVFVRCSFFKIPEAVVKIFGQLVHQKSAEKIPVRFSLYKKLADGAVIFASELNARELAPGLYFLHIYAEELRTGSKSHTSSTLTIGQKEGVNHPLL
ncbi:MAG: VWA domain-containing protein [Candidatus Aminicenantes bacterium]|nr:VWA domain-containing protein [Candidatus Aminicenantes bacterium]